MKRPLLLFPIGGALILLLLAAGCATYQPMPMEEVPFKSRAVTQSDEDVTVTVAVLSPEESQKVFGVKVASKDIQPVWVEIRNRGERPYWFFPSRIDPDYYSPGEVAYMNRIFMAPETNREMRVFYESLDFKALIPPQGEVSGFIHTKLDPGFKYVNISMFGSEGFKTFHFVTEVPGIKADYQTVNKEDLYTPEDYIMLEDEQELKTALENLPCCTNNEKGTRNGDPLNLVFIGDVEDILAALVGSGWDVTERSSLASYWRTFRSWLFGRRYRHSPVSSLFVFERRQDAALQKARQTVNERNHLRVWLTPLIYEGQPVWVGQISRDIGVKLTLRTGFLTTHVIDPDVDNDRYFLIQNLIDAQSLTRLGFTEGVGPSLPEDPNRNLGHDPYYTDGLRAVMECTERPTPPTEIRYFDWEWPPETKPYSGLLLGSQPDAAEKEPEDMQEP